MRMQTPPKRRDSTHQQRSESAPRRRAPPRLPRRDLAQVVHRLRALHARDELHGRPVRTAELVRPVCHVDLLRHVVQVLRRVDLREDERADARRTHL